MRKNIAVNELGGLLNQGRCAVLATKYADGTTLLSPVWHEWSEGGFTIVIFDGDVKARHIKRDPRVSIVVADDRVPMAGIEVRGEVSDRANGARSGDPAPHGRAVHRSGSAAMRTSMALTRRPS